MQKLVINFIKETKKSFFIIEKIKKYQKCPALVGQPVHDDAGHAGHGAGALGEVAHCALVLLPPRAAAAAAADGGGRRSGGPPPPPPPPPPPSLPPRRRSGRQSGRHSSCPPSGRSWRAA